MEALLPSGILYGAVSRLSAIAEIEHGEKSRPAVRADDDAEVADGDLADVGKRRADFIAHMLGVLEAVGMEDVHLKPLGVDLLEVVRDAAQYLCERRLPAAHLLWPGKALPAQI